MQRGDGEIRVMEKLFVSQIESNPEGNTDVNNMSACLTYCTSKRRRKHWTAQHCFSVVVLCCLACHQSAYLH